MLAGSVSRQVLHTGVFQAQSNHLMVERVVRRRFVRLFFVGRGFIQFAQRSLRTCQKLPVIRFFGDFGLTGPDIPANARP